MSSSLKEEYYKKAGILLYLGQSVLKAMFLERWKHVTGKEWSEDQAYQLIQQFGKNVYKDAPTDQKRMIQSGKVCEWEIPLLAKLLLSAFNQPSASNGATEKEEKVRAGIYALKKIWLRVHHHNKEKKISKMEYEELEAGFRTCVHAIRDEDDDDPDQKNTNSGGSSDAAPAESPASRDDMEKSNEVQKEPAKLPEYLWNSERLEVINRHRGFSKGFKSGKLTMFGLRDKQDDAIIIDPKWEDKLPMKCDKMQPIKISDMDPDADGVYYNEIIHLTLIEDPVFMAGVHQVGQDEDGNVTRISFYDIQHTQNTAEALQLGRRVTLMHPWMKWIIGGSSGIRVEGAKNLIIRNLLQNICRFCSKENAQQRCARCKLAKYCSKECQVADWKSLNHKLVCHKQC